MVAGLRVARRASLALPALERLAGHLHSRAATADYLLAQGMVGFWIEGRPAADVRAPLEEAFARPGPVSENWDTRGPATWALIFAEGYDTAQAVLESMRAEAMAYLDAAAETLRNRGIAVETRVVVKLGVAGAILEELGQAGDVLAP